MKTKTFILFIALIILQPAFSSLFAQTEESVDAEIGARISAEAHYKVLRNLTATLKEEVRLDNNFKSFNRIHSTLGLRYKVTPFLKIGIGYALINGYDSDINGFQTARHRLMADVTGTLKLDQWQISLRERIQVTHRTDDFNSYQNPANNWMLKSQLTVKYKGLRRLTPYAYVELRHRLNAPTVQASYIYGYNRNSKTYANVYAYEIDEDSYDDLRDTKGYKNNVYQTDDSYYCAKGDEGWFLDGFNTVSLNRFRGSIGAEYKLDAHNMLNASVLLDYNTENEVDANAEGTKLKSYIHQTGFAAWLCIGYEYSF